MPKKTKEVPAHVEWLGDDGQFITGIPNKDLTSHEWNALSKTKKKRAVESGLYKIVSKKVKEKENA